MALMLLAHRHTFASEIFRSVRCADSLKRYGADVSGEIQDDETDGRRVQIERISRRSCPPVERNGRNEKEPDEETT